MPIRTEPGHTARRSCVVGDRLASREVLHPSGDCTSRIRLTRDYHPRHLPHVGFLNPSAVCSSAWLACSVSCRRHLWGSKNGRESPTFLPAARPCPKATNCDQLPGRCNRLGDCRSTARNDGSGFSAPILARRLPPMCHSPRSSEKNPGRRAHEPPSDRRTDTLMKSQFRCRKRNGPRRPLGVVVLPKG